MTTTYNETVTDFEAAFHELLATAASFPDEKKTAAGACGDWSLREVLAHLAGWLVEAKRRFPRFALGTGKVTYNEDAFNEVSLWLRANKDFDQIAEELAHRVRELAIIAREIADHHRERDERYVKWLKALADDARQHEAEVRAFRDATIS